MNIASRRVALNDAPRQFQGSVNVRPYGELVFDQDQSNAPAGGQGILLRAVLAGKRMLVKLFTEPMARRLQQIVDLQLHLKDSILFAAFPIRQERWKLANDEVFDSTIMPDLNADGVRTIRLDDWLALPATQANLKYRQNVASQLWCLVQQLEKRSLVHCDLSSSNLMISIINGIPYLRVVDLENLTGPGIDGHTQCAGLPAYQYAELRNGTTNRVESDRYAAAILTVEIIYAPELIKATGDASLFGLDDEHTGKFLPNVDGRIAQFFRPHTGGQIWRAIPEPKAWLKVLGTWLGQ